MKTDYRAFISYVCNREMKKESRNGWRQREKKGWGDKRGKKRDRKIVS